MMHWWDNACIDTYTEDIHESMYVRVHSYVHLRSTHHTRHHKVNSSRSNQQRHVQGAANALSMHDVVIMSLWRLRYLKDRWMGCVRLETTFPSMELILKHPPPSLFYPHTYIYICIYVCIIRIRIKPKLGPMIRSKRSCVEIITS